ncbi:MAG TPA: hypothetical protein VN181_04760 [Thermoanaerobaculia bacterium]|nr:hypothetical protein [Thermoanaerobaculia bacterium]
MTTMAQPATTFADVRHHPLTTAALVSLFWVAAAVLVATCHTELDALSPSGGAVATIAAIVGVAYAYTRLCARYAEISHALGVGIAWLALAIITEITISSRIGHGWYSLIGTPDRPLLRNVFLFVWIFSPALFAHRETEA